MTLLFGDDPYVHVPVSWSVCVVSDWPRELVLLSRWSPSTLPSRLTVCGGHQVSALDRGHAWWERGSVCKWCIQFNFSWIYTLLNNLSEHLHKQGVVTIKLQTTSHIHCMEVSWSKLIIGFAVRPIQNCWTSVWTLLQFQDVKDEAL